uniref:Myoneurin n=1 Tax=Tetraodon nigroviridis TaxID=99883 RepID=H3CG39_TETNG
AQMAHVASHGKLLLQRLHEQREMDFLCDITIMVRDVEFRAHRNILAAFSKYFSSQAEKGQEITTLDPEKVSRYALEKLLEFIYTGQMNLSRSTKLLLFTQNKLYTDQVLDQGSVAGLNSVCGFSTRQAAVRRAAVFLGMSEATKYMEEIPHWAEQGEASQSEADKETGPSPPSPASAGSASCAGSPVNRVGATGMEVMKSSIPQRLRAQGGGGAEDPRVSAVSRRRSAASSEDTPKPQSSKAEEASEESDASVKDFGDTSADWSPSQEDDPPVKKPRLSDLPLSCTECNKLFKDVSSLHRHEKIHSGLKPFVCIFCSKSFRQATQLKTHLRIHTGEKPFNCPDCDKCFAQKCQLVAHRRMHHGEEKPYTCERCGFKFATSSNYKIHIRLHSGEKPYVCDVCGQAFAQSSTLTYHKRRHTGEKPYQCDLCGMSFSVSSSLIAHARKHTGETPYKCSQPQCSSSFVTSSELKKHMRRLHPDGNSGVQCLLCGNRFASVKNMIKHQEKAHA